MDPQSFLRGILSSFQLLVLTTPVNSPATSIILLVARLLTISIVLRTYLVPWALHLLFQRFRVRSVSLRSIRGIYFHQGRNTLYIDRIGLSYHRPSGMVVSRLTIKVEGFKLEISKPSDMFESSIKRQRSHRRMPTLSDFAPSPIAFRIRSVIYAMYAGLEPYFRPLVRTCFISALRLLIRCLPALTQVLDFEVDSAILELEELSGVIFSLKDMVLSSKVVFSQLESVAFTQTPQPRPIYKKHSRFLSMMDWRGRFSSNVKRTWARAWGKTRGTASVSIKIQEVSGVRTFTHGKSTIFELPGSEFHGSVGINSYRGIEPHSLNAALKLDSVNVSIDQLRTILATLKGGRVKTPVDEMDHEFVESPISPMRSPGSPTIPFTNPFPKSIHFGRGPSMPVKKLKAHSALSILSSVKSIRFHVSGVDLECGPSEYESQAHKLLVQDFTVSAGLSHSDDNDMHKTILGRSANRDFLDHDVYMADFSMHQMTLERNAMGSSEALATVGPVGLRTLATQLPGLLMANSSFMSGDPNAALLALRLKVERIDVMQDWDSIRKVLLRPRSGPSTKHDTSGTWSQTLNSIPKVLVEIEVGNVRANFPFSRRGNHVAVEMKTNGVVMSVSSQFMSDFPRARKQFARALPSEARPIRMLTAIALAAEPWEIGLRSDAHFEDSDPAAPLCSLETELEPVLTIDAIGLNGSGTTLGTISEDDIVSLDVSSTFVEAHCSTEALSLELWHPKVMSAVAMLVDIISAKPKSSSLPKSHSHLKLLPGLSLTLAISRFTIFVTSPDFNPQEEMVISRGIAFHSGVSIHYCSISLSHVASVGDLSFLAQTRHKLYLPEERIMDALSKARHTQQPTSANDLVRVLLWDTGLRSAVATEFVADDPYSMQQVPFKEQNMEFMSIPYTRIDLTYLSIRGDVPNTKCEAVVTIPIVLFKLELVHAYNLLLAIQRLKSLSSPRRAAQPIHEDNDSSQRLQLNLRLQVHSLELLFKFPTKQSICTRVSNLNVRSALGQNTNVHLETWLFWVPRPRRKGEDGPGDFRWEEFGCLRGWNLHIEQSRKPASITVKGDTGRIRIPHQFVLSELVLSITLTAKCVKHLSQVVSMAKFTEMDTPAAEDPKHVPKVNFEVHRLVLEAADDPFESKLSLISRAGLRASEIMRTHEDAFDAKVAAIKASEYPLPDDGVFTDEMDGYRFSSSHSVTIDEARQRLLFVHSKTWREVHAAYQQKHHGHSGASSSTVRDGRFAEPVLIAVTPSPPGSPLFRVTIESLRVHIAGPSFPIQKLPDFLFEQGAGQPRDTEYFLLVPLNLSLSLSCLEVTLRDYPLPLLSIQPSSGQREPVFHFDSDLVIAEQVGNSRSIEWWDCVVVDQDFGLQGASAFSFRVPKTIMPVKTYANPVIRITTQDVTALCWGVSYGPAIQDVMRVVETFSSAPRDPSPPLGFWDKLRLVFHWKMLASFKGAVHLNMKGSRDPYNVIHHGAGFALCWSGNPKILVGHHNDDGELIQVLSDVMSVEIHNFEKLHQFSDPPVSPFDLNSRQNSNRPFSAQNLCELRKTCAKLTSGVRYGIRFDLERTCRSECPHCFEPNHRRKCRIFNFRPHYEVQLERKSKPLLQTSSSDSYQGFRSDFVHMSISLTSAVRHTRDHGLSSFSNFHLTPRAFASFWNWWGLFDGRLSLPIRQGSYYRHRIVSPKFGRHLATIKYRISIPHLFISHVYIDESRQSWSDGITRFVGVKALIDHFHADMHQRDQETTQFNPLLGTTEVIRHKPFHAIEVVLKGLDLRAMLATFPEPVKKEIFPEECPEMDKDKIRSNLPVVDPASIWVDNDDFVELDWSSTKTPKVNLLPSAACPNFTYFKRTPEPDSTQSHQRTEFSKFGNEATHVCLLGKESSAPQIQTHLVSARIEELRKILLRDPTNTSIERMIRLLEDYVNLLRGTESGNRSTYYMATETVSSEEWASFDNVYQVHCPKVFMNESVRDIMMQYYYCSRARRGFEYHLATRAVKFIRDQHREQVGFDDSVDDHSPAKGSTNVAQAAFKSIRKTLGGGPETQVITNVLEDDLDEAPPPVLDPLDGWCQGVSLKRSHFCVLLKPQIVLQSETNKESVCVVAAGVAKLQTNIIMDDSNADDPVSGKIMSRTYTTLHGLQTFSPSTASLSEDGCVPVEVLIDFRCESSDFERLVPQTEATICYDKFNRLRLRNDVTSVTTVGKANQNNAHLQDQTDLLNIHVPQFTVSASDGHFAAISDIVTKLLLFSDSAHKTRLDRLETLLFSYDFTDLDSSANVVSDLQARLREAVQHEQAVRWRLQRLALSTDQCKLEIAKIKADVLALADELSYVFEAIKLAQDKSDGNSDRKSALLLLASSPDLSWRMLDSHRDLLAKLSVKHVRFSWLSRQDGATVNSLKVGDLHAFDGSANATWSELLCKHSEPSGHPLVKRDLFALSSWTVLAPVGGITIYEKFEVLLHPIRLQLDTRVGERIMEYIWPARKHRHNLENSNVAQPPQHLLEPPSPSSPSFPSSRPPTSSKRPSLDLLSRKPRKSLDLNTHSNSDTLRPGPLRRLGTSRSFTDLRSANLNSGYSTPTFHRNHSTDALSQPSSPSEGSGPVRKGTGYFAAMQQTNDAVEMKTRSSQKTFVAVRIASLHLLLSIMKEDAFLCRDAHISTRDLHYRNQVWSFEELVEQFIPSDPSWKGWVKMAFQQPFFEVFPVARELLSKTKRIASKSGTPVEVPTPRATSNGKLRKPPHMLKDAHSENTIRKVSTSKPTQIFVEEPESMDSSAEPPQHEKRAGHKSRPRVFSLFRRSSNTLNPLDPVDLENKLEHH